jgi:hypothetical protein
VIIDPLLRGRRRRGLGEEREGEREREKGWVYTET